VAGAKGGVGVTTLAANLSVYLATIGRRVALVDADATCASTHTSVGLTAEHALSQPLLGQADLPAPDAVPDDAWCAGLSAATMHATCVQGLSHVYLGLDQQSGPAAQARMQCVLPVLRRFAVDYVVLDAGRGGAAALAWPASDAALFVTTADPAAVEGTYRFISDLLLGQLHRFATTLDPALLQRLPERSYAQLWSKSSLWQCLRGVPAPVLAQVEAELSALRFRFVVNQARGRADLELGDGMRLAARWQLGVTLESLGYVDVDESVVAAARLRRPVLIENPATKASKSLEKIARRLLSLGTRQPSGRRLAAAPAESHHALLGLERGATEEEIRRAYKRAKEIYDPGSLVCYGLFDAAGFAQVQARLQEAFDVLIDPARRRPYELSVFPAPPSEAEVSPRQPAVELPHLPPPVITPETEFTGALLKAVRQSQGVPLKHISQRTKVGLHVLQAIEEDDFTALPAPVYVKGFVSEFAKCLALDADHVSTTYARRYRRAVRSQSGW
ncbi:MAG: helix-turn-helix domain-containing protein, partial [Polyangiales bacterium]